MDKKEQVAEVLGTELPWLQEDLLKFADKVLALFPEPSVEDVEGIEKILKDWNITEELGFRHKLALALSKLRSKGEGEGR